MVEKICLSTLCLDWYWVFQILGIGLALIWLIKKYTNKKYPTMNLLIWCILLLIIIVGGYCYSQIWGVLEYYIIAPDIELIETLQKETFHSGGGRWYGALIGNLIFTTLIVVFWKNSNSLWQLWDELIIPTLGGFSIAKLGCLFSGHGCYGICTTLPWGMYFSYGTAPSLLPVHPTPLYDILLHLGLLFYLIYLTKKKEKLWLGQLALSGFIGTSIFHIGVEFVRNNPKVIANLSFAQVNYIVLLILSGFLFFLKKNQEAQFNSIV